MDEALNAIRPYTITSAMRIVPTVDDDNDPRKVSVDETPDGILLMKDFCECASSLLAPI